MKLIIVEAPTKIKTLKTFVKKNDYDFVASYGHVRNLIPKSGSISISDSTIKYKWQTSDRWNKIFEKIKSNDIREIIIATDPDREGECIAWHISDMLFTEGLNDISISRIRFSEITKDAFLHAIDHLDVINQNLVNAALSRMALDYLVGFGFSPTLWNNIPGGRSIGRVQTPALALIVEREMNIINFISNKYYVIKAIVNELYDSESFDFDNNFLNMHECEKKMEILKSQKIESVVSKENERKESDFTPLITSELQKIANIKLNWSGTKTMKVAQSLYEGVTIDGKGLSFITYMRTDGKTLSEEFLNKANGFMNDNYAEHHKSIDKNYFKGLKGKGITQESHEAIRPIKLDNRPEDYRSHFTDDEFKLYSLIWSHTVKCFCKNPIYKIQNITIKLSQNEFVLKYKYYLYEGYLKFLDGVEHPLSPLSTENIKGLNFEIMEKETKRPNRFTEHGLIDALETLSIGRPSTYASITQTLKDRGYVCMSGKAIYPTKLGMLIVEFMKKFAGNYIDKSFTSNMENNLDLIARDKFDHLNYLNDCNDDILNIVNFIGNERDILSDVKHQLLKNIKLTPNVLKNKICEEDRIDFYFHGDHVMMFNEANLIDFSAKIKDEFFEDRTLLRLSCMVPFFISTRSVLIERDGKFKLVKYGKETTVYGTFLHSLLNQKIGK